MGYFTKNIILYVFYMYGYFACMYICELKRLEENFKFLGLQLDMVVNCHVGSGN